MNLTSDTVCSNRKRMDPMTNEQKTFKDKVKEVIEEVKPYLQQDGGDIELIDAIEDTGVVKVRLQGACAHCPASTYTLQMAVEARLKEMIPEVQKVEAV